MDNGLRSNEPLTEAELREQFEEYAALKKIEDRELGYKCYRAGWKARAYNDAVEDQLMTKTEIGLALSKVATLTVHGAADGGWEISEDGYGSLFRVDDVQAALGIEET